MKVLHIANKNNGNGVASFIMNYYRHIDYNKIQFDFISHSSLEDSNAEEIQNLGGNVFNVPSYKKYLFKYINSVYKIIKSGTYDIIHCHQFPIDIISLFIAKKKGIKVRIFHAHNNAFYSFVKRLLVYLFRNIWGCVVTDFSACSVDAGHFFFGNRYKYIIFNNAIEPERYVFNSIARNSIRNNLYLPENAFVIGYVARFVKQKNYFFLINVFKNILYKNDNSFLLLIGDGKLLKKIKKYVATLNLLKNVLFYGVSERVYELYSAMDVFVFPSLFEGLGIAGIEAQCAGLPVIASLNIPKEMQVTDLVSWLDLKVGAEKWAEKVLEYSIPKKRENMTEIITRNGYNIKNECNKLENEYARLIQLRTEV